MKQSTQNLKPAGGRGYSEVPAARNGGGIVMGRSGTADMKANNYARGLGGQQQHLNLQQ